MQTKKQEIIEYYFNQKLSQSQTATKMGVSRSRIGQLMKEYNLINRSYADASSNMNNQRIITFDQHQLDLMFGSMLGDAGMYVNKMKSNKTNNVMTIMRLHFAHSVKQLDYLLHKKNIINGSKVMERISGHGSTIKHYAFCHTPTLLQYKDYFLDKNNNKLVSEKWVEQLNWRSIAYWYMDDGCLIINNKSPKINFHTESFSRSETDILINTLENRFGLKTRTATCNNDPNQQKIVSRHKKEAESFLEQIKPYIIKLFNYKIRWII